MVSRQSLMNGHRQNTLDKGVVEGLRRPISKDPVAAASISPTSAHCVKKRNHDETPLPVVDCKKTCLVDHGENAVVISEEQEWQNRRWMYEFQHRRLTVLEMITICGSIDELKRLLEWLFETHCVETFVLDLMVDFWELFPEAARCKLTLFRRHSCWQQLLLLMERSRRLPRVSESIQNAAFAILKNQWAADVKALARNTGHVSDLAIWLPTRGGRWSDQQLQDFTRRFSILVNPKKQTLHGAKQRYINQLRALRNDAQARSQHQSLRAVSADGKMIHSVSLNSMRDEGSGFGSSQILEKMLNRKNFMPSFQQAPLYESLLTFSPAGSCGKLGARGLLLPTKGRVDQFLYLQPPFRSASETFLRKPVRVLDRTTIERVLYIHQGELGYAIPSQCDVILSDKATTCHILSIQSTSSHALVPTLTSLSHIDGPLYTECLQEMIETHVRHHNGNERQNQGLAHKVDLLIDVVGGFDDNQGASSEISSWLFQALAYFADEFHDVLTMTIRTCAISCMNDAGDFSPIGRGMGVDLRTGEAFLAKADSSVAGPASQLRSSRIWADGGEGRLAVVHTSTSNNFVIHPFEFRAMDNLRAYLRMPDRKMIRRTSTSPDAEEPDFCADVRNTIRFMHAVDCRRVFGPNLDLSLFYLRAGSSNIWKRSS